MKKLCDYIVGPTTTVRDVIEVINRGAAQIALVADAEQKLLGLITDGDIRRALLRNESLTSLAANIMCQNFHSLPKNATEKEALTVMHREVISHMPVLDEQGRVVNLFLLDELVRKKKLPNRAVIMAGGEGKRLGALTQSCPKPMLRVGGKPLLEIILEHCIDAGLQHFHLSVNYLKEQIKDYFGDGSSWNVTIDYLEETHPLGTGGALSLLTEKLSEPLFVLNGDVLNKVDYGRLLSLHHEHKAAATMCVHEHSTQIPYGVVLLDDVKVLEIEEKPILNNFVNAGIYLLDPVLLDLVPQNQFFDMPQLLEKAIKLNYLVTAFPVHEYWLDIGHPETLQRANDEWYRAPDV